MGKLGRVVGWQTGPAGGYRLTGGGWLGRRSLSLQAMVWCRYTKLGFSDPV